MRTSLSPNITQRIQGGGEVEERINKRGPTKRAKKNPTTSPKQRRGEEKPNKHHSKNEKATTKKEGKRSQTSALKEEKRANKAHQAFKTARSSSDPFKQCGSCEDVQCLRKDLKPG